jgi:FkbM family methyltransferase
MNDGITFRTDFGCYWPDYDHKPEACFKRVMGRITDQDFAIGYAREHRVCVQAGGHAGLWPKRLAAKFDLVYTFEPDPILYRCLELNIKGDRKIRPYQQALATEEGQLALRPHVSAGSWRIDDEGTVPVWGTTIDNLALEACDVIYLDVEGYEVEALKGAEETIKRFAPVIHVEELPRSKDDIRAHMARLKYRLVKTIHADAVYIR